jgi:uncharacterized protein YggE
MNKLTALLCCTTLFATATAVANPVSHQRTISTNGYGEVKVQPDIAKLKLTVSVTKKKSIDAKRESDSRVNTLLADLKKSGIGDDDIIAANLQTSPRFEHSSISERQFVGYQASRNIEITIRNLSQLTDIMDIALTNNIQTINKIAYQSSSAEQHKNQARLNAISDSKNKANFLAQAYDAELGAISTISYHSNRHINQSYSESMVMADAKFSSTPSNRGVYKTREITFTDNIQVVFDLIVDQ